jgi:autonomous glycyl radical cofactor GrcA
VSARRKTGERPKVDRQLKIDRLPLKFRDRIQVERNTLVRTWKEIQDDSPSWKEWDEVAPEVQVLFEGRRLPETNLQRWYDLRVRQVQRDVMAAAAQAREIAQAFSKATVKGADESVLNAARDLIFSILQQGDMKSRAFAARALVGLGEVMQTARANTIKERKVAVEERRIVQLEKDADLKRKRLEKETDDAAKKLSKGEDITIDDINRLRERTFGLPPVQRSA